MIRNSELASAALFALILLWAPLPFGSVTPGFRTLLMVLIALALLVAAVTSKEVPERQVLIPVCCLVAVGLMGLLQSMSWPAWVARWLSPGHWQLSSLSGAEPSSLPLSLAPWSSRLVGVVWCSVAAGGLVAYMVARVPWGRVMLLLSIVFSGLLQTGYGVWSLVSNPDRVFGTDVPSSAGRLRGSFVNPDHLAFYLGLILPMLFAWSLVFVRRRYLARGPQQWWPVVTPIVLWLVLFVGAALTGSRAGLAVAGVVAIFQILLLAWIWRSWVVALAGASLLLTGGAVLSWLSAQDALGRLLSTSSYEVQWNARFLAYQATWEVVERFPFLGSGLGTFREAISLTRPEGLDGQWWHAHSDYLELASNVGIVGVLLVGTALASTIRSLLRRVRSRSRSEPLALAVGALGALLAAALHSVVDFGLSMPANALTLTSLLAIVLAVGHQGARQA